jgi:hypothetical protein
MIDLDEGSKNLKKITSQAIMAVEEKRGRCVGCPRNKGFQAIVPPGIGVRVRKITPETIGVRVCCGRPGNLVRPVQGEHCALLERDLKKKTRAEWLALQQEAVASGASA